MRCQISDQIAGHREELGGDVMVRSSVPQDLLGLQEAHGHGGAWEVTSVSGLDRPAPGM